MPPSTELRRSRCSWVSSHRQRKAAVGGTARGFGGTCLSVWKLQECPMNTTFFIDALRLIPGGDPSMLLQITRDKCTLQELEAVAEFGLRVEAPADAHQASQCAQWAMAVQEHPNNPLPESHALLLHNIATISCHELRKFGASSRYSSAHLYFFLVGAVVQSADWGPDDLSEVYIAICYEEWFNDPASFQAVLNFASWIQSKSRYHDHVLVWRGIFALASLTLATELLNDRLLLQRVEQSVAELNGSESNVCVRRVQAMRNVFKSALDIFQSLHDKTFDK